MDGFDIDSDDPKRIQNYLRRVNPRHLVVDLKPAVLNGKEHRFSINAKIYDNSPGITRIRIEVARPELFALDPEVNFVVSNLGFPIEQYKGLISIDFRVTETDLYLSLWTNSATSNDWKLTDEERKFLKGFANKVFCTAIEICPYFDPPVLINRNSSTLTLEADSSIIDKGLSFYKQLIREIENGAHPYKAFHDLSKSYFIRLLEYYQIKLGLTAISNIKDLQSTFSVKMKGKLSVFLRNCRLSHEEILQQMKAEILQQPFSYRHDVLFFPSQVDSKRQYQIFIQSDGTNRIYDTQKKSWHCPHTLSLHELKAIMLSKSFICTKCI